MNIPVSDKIVPLNVRNLVGANLLSQYFYNEFKACSISSHTSSHASKPTESRMSSSEMPIFKRSSFGTTACVIVAGCWMSVSASPKLTASFIILVGLIRVEHLLYFHLFQRKSFLLLQSFAFDR